MPSFGFAQDLSSRAKPASVFADIIPRQADHALPWILAHHQRTPTNRKRQSWKNSGGLPSKAWRMNWKTHPMRNRANAYSHRRWKKMLATKSGTESRMVGMPSV